MDLFKDEIHKEFSQTLLNKIGFLDKYYDKLELLNENEVIIVNKILPELINLLPILIENVNGFDIPFQRIVINKNNKRASSLVHLQYPPMIDAYKLGYNRASLKGQSIFYAGISNILPIAVETLPQKGQLISTSKWNLKKGVLKMFVICQDSVIAHSNPIELLNCFNNYNRMLHQIPANNRIIIEKIYNLIIKAFTRKVDYKNKQGYLFSALIANTLFNNKNYQVDAIYYPSVPNNGSVMNIAVKPDIVDNQFEMIEVTESIVIGDCKEEKNWHLFNTAKCKKYNKDTLGLEWENYQIPEKHIVNKIISDFNIKLF